MKTRWKRLACTAALLFVAVTALCWWALTNRADRQTESLLDYAMLDLDATLNGSIDTMLMHAADSIAEQLGRPKPLSPGEIALIARQRDLDEVNIVSRDGIFIASTDAGLVGLTMADRPKSAEFLVLTNGVRHALSHAFRPGAHNTEVRRKYVGVAFPGGNGLVQVGVDEDRVTKMFPSIMGFIFDAWLLGEHGWFLCADLADGHLISNPARHRDEAECLSETGYDPRAPEAVEDGRTTFRMRIFGEICYCRAVVFCGHRVIAALPPSEFHSTRTAYAAIVATILAGVLTLVVLLVRRIDMASERLKAFYAAEEAARGHDMEIARNIQSSALPVPLAENPYFRIAASMTPARDIGGDFYDFFMLDPTHLAFLVADVSGKGITAALYMMTAKTLVKNAILATRDPAAAFTLANADLCRNNTANMFLTAWGGVLDLETGLVTFADAGHNPPVKVGGAATAAPDGRRLEWLTGKSGPMLAFFEDVQYKARTVALNPGDTLFLYTDGVTEAMDPKGGLFGDERLRAALAALGEPVPGVACGVVRAAVAAFAAGAPAADDLTVLAVQYVSRPDMFVRSFQPTQAGVSQASEFLDECLGEKAHLPPPGVAPSVAATLHVILDEVASNVVKHSGASGFEVDIEIAADPPGVKLTVIDDGKPYDPLAHADPDTALPAAERPIGGLGIMMVKKMADSVSYERVRNRNNLSVFKALDGSAAPRGRLQAGR